ncbi:NADH oxidase [Streptomyces zaomyceticus]|uniref:NADH oxidase n=1 Tax=Streptomyces zaomyceticus TaxID=68286 RepID=UPI0035D586CD
MSDTDEHQVVHLWSLDEDVVLVGGDDDFETVLSGRWGAQRLKTDGLVREALRRMQLGPVRLTNVGQAPGTGAPGCLILLPVLREVAHLVVRTIAMDDLLGPLLSAHPLSRDAVFRLGAVPADRRFRLVVGTSLVLRADGLVMEVRDSAYRVVVHRPEAVWIVGMLTRPCRAEEAVAALPLPAGVTRGVIGYLLAAGMAVPVDPPPGVPVDPAPGFPVDPSPGVPVAPLPGATVASPPGFPVDPPPGVPVDPLRVVPPPGAPAPPRYGPSGSSGLPALPAPDVS